MQDKIPLQWREANVEHFTTNKRSKSMCPNYRPCKLLESVIRGVVLSFLEKHNKITPFQHGFRTGYSCATQLLMGVQTFLHYMELHYDVDCIC